MKRLVWAFVAAASILAAVSGCCGVPLYFVNHLRLQNNPDGLYWRYKDELHEYARRLDAGDVEFVEGCGYAVPQCLIDHGACRCVKRADCFCVTFCQDFFDTPLPELWYSPSGFAPVPEPVAKMNRDWPRHKWVPLTRNWAANYR